MVVVVEGEIAIFAHKRCVRFSSCDHIQQRVTIALWGEERSWYSQGVVYIGSQYIGTSSTYLVAFPYDIYVAILNNNDDDDSFFQM